MAKANAQNEIDAALPIRVVLTDVSGVASSNTAVTIADNGNAVEGATTDAAVVTDAAGTVSGKLRGLVKILSAAATVSDGRLVVTTAGTAVNFPSVAAKSVAITAETDNTGAIVIGGSTVVAALATRSGIPLSAGDTAVFSVANINELWIDATVNTDGVTYAVLV